MTDKEVKYRRMIVRKPIEADEEKKKKFWGSRFGDQPSWEIVRKISLYLLTTEDNDKEIVRKKLVRELAKNNMPGDKYIVQSSYFFQVKLPLTYISDEEIERERKRMMMR